MLEDIAGAIAEYERSSTAAQCEAVIHHLDNVVRDARTLMARAHVILEKRIAEERQMERLKRQADFPAAQKIGVN